MSHQLKVIISSTTRDLPEHRKEVMDACLRQGKFPMMMEHLPASDDEAISASLKLVDDAEIYVGVFAHRYGYVPKDNNPRQISITEMEYDRAVERKIPRMIFIVDKHLPLADFTIDNIDTGEDAMKLIQFKSRIEMANIVNFFKSPADLRAHVINSLSQHHQPDLETFHYVSDIPTPPEAFVAHPYTLLQTHQLVGRQPELNLLTDWVTRKQERIYQARIMNVIAIGGLGKSALTWKWFNDIAPQEIKPLAGCLWWSFYESDATFENFVTRALAYVTRRPHNEVQKIRPPEREAQLLASLDREPYLVVLDGLERMLIAYARMDAAHLSDDDLDRQTANIVANAYGLPASAAQSFTGEHLLRKTADPRGGAFLRKLSGVHATRILISTRLYPADLQMVTGEPLPGCAAVFLTELADDDALELWRAFGVSGARDSLLPLLNRVGNHLLLIQALAREVARYRRAPGDFERWRRDHPDFDPFSLPLVQVKSHVLEFALRGLEDKVRQALQVITGFRMPARYDTLDALLIGEGKPCVDERELDKVLTELEDRGLVGWDKRANRYDLHPIVRGVVWSGLGEDTRRGVYTSLHAYFEALPMIDNDFVEVDSLEVLTPVIELYNTLIGLGRYHDAYRVFRDRLSHAMRYRLSAGRQIVELLKLLFPDGLDHLPRLNSSDDQANTLNGLAQGYKFSGRPEYAVLFYRRAVTICSRMGRDDAISVALCNLSDTLRLTGMLHKSEVAVRRALLISRNQHSRLDEAVSLIWLGLTLAARGIAHESKVALERSLRMFVAHSNKQAEGFASSNLAQRALWFSEFATAHSFARRAWDLAYFLNHESDFIHASRRQGEAALGLNDFATADERLHYALIHARIVNRVEEELSTLVTLAELRRQQGNMKAAREFLDDVLDAAERGPFPLIHADACNVLTRIERDAGNTASAIEAATRSYQLAWCDGPPFAYHSGLLTAQNQLQELGALEPQMPRFDKARFEPMPEVKIDTEEEFHAGENANI